MRAGSTIEEVLLFPYKVSHVANVGLIQHNFQLQLNIRETFPCSQTP